MRYKLTGYNQDEGKHITYARGLTLLEARKRKKELMQIGEPVFLWEDQEAEEQMRQRKI